MPAHSRKTKYRVGLFVVLSIGALAGVLALLGVFGGQYAPQRYYIEFEGSVVGLRERASAITYRGVKVGMVSDIHFDVADPSLIIVGVDVDPEFRLKETMQAFLVYKDLTGIRDIELYGGERDDPDVLPGYSLRGEKTILEEFGPMAEGLLSGSSSLIDRANALLDDDNRSRVASALANIDQITTNALSLPSDAAAGIERWNESLDRVVKVFEDMGSQTQGVDNLINNVGQDLEDTLSAVRSLAQNPNAEAALESAADALNSLKILIQNINGAVDAAELEQTFDEFRDLMREVTKLSRSANSLIGENRSEMRKIITNLRQSADNLREITLTIRNNPSVLIRGAPPDARRGR